MNLLRLFKGWGVFVISLFLWLIGIIIFPITILLVFAAYFLTFLSIFRSKRSPFLKIPLVVVIIPLSLALYLAWVHFSGYITSAIDAGIVMIYFFPLLALTGVVGLLSGGLVAFLNHLSKKKEKKNKRGRLT